MPKKPPTVCNAIGCPTLTYNGYCDEHKHDVDREYAQSRDDIREQKFYKSKEWKKLREYKRSVNPLCEECLLIGMATPMDVADHHVEIKDDWSRRLDLSNLMSLCHSCHNKKTREEVKKRNNNINNNNYNKINNNDYNQVNNNNYNKVNNWYLE